MCFSYLGYIYLNLIALWAVNIVCMILVFWFCVYVCWNFFCGLCIIIYHKFLMLEKNVYSLNVYIYIYIHMYACIYIYISIYVDTYVYIYLSKYCYIIQTLSIVILSLLGLLLSETGILKISTIVMKPLVSLRSSEFFFFSPFWYMLYWLVLNFFFFFFAP